MVMGEGIHIGAGSKTVCGIHLVPGVSVAIPTSGESKLKGSF